MGKQGKATLWKEDSRTTELGQDTGGKREPWGGQSWISQPPCTGRSDVGGTVTGCRDTQMGNCIMTMHVTRPPAVTRASRNKLYNHRILDSNPCAAIAR